MDQDPNVHAHPELQQLRIKLKNVYNSILNYHPPIARFPILDSSLETDANKEGRWLHHEHIYGLKTLRDSVKTDLDILEKFLDNFESTHLPPLSTNASYLIAVWHEVICAPHSVDAIFKSIPLANSGQRAVKVDVIADSGRHWIRVNTIKNTRLLAEFREIDSYLTDSDNSSYENLQDARPTLAQSEFDNSILRMGKLLLAAAKANPLGDTTDVPQVTLRLTRLDPSPVREDGEENDPRIAQTLQILREMGIVIKLGERQEADLPPTKNPRPFHRPSTSLKPTRNINLDLSVLIALISDLTHSPLPKNTNEANLRFIPPNHYREWKERKGKKEITTKGVCSLNTGNEEVDVSGISNDGVKHSRALTDQLLQEMRKSLLQEIHDTISVLPSVPVDEGPQRLGVRFWTTPEARDHCLRIVSKIGGPKEKRRAHAMFPADSALLNEDLSPIEAEKLYWQDSRYPINFIPLFPIDLHPPSLGPDIKNFPKSPVTIHPFQFSKILAKTCRDILTQETVPHSGVLSENRMENWRKEEIQRAIITKSNPRLTAHTVQSLLWGAELGLTTLTANKTSIRTILKETKLARIAGKIEGVNEETRELDINEDYRAVIWIIDPRSLAEGMTNQPR